MPYQGFDDERAACLSPVELQRTPLNAVDRVRVPYEHDWRSLYKLVQLYAPRLVVMYRYRKYRLQAIRRRPERSSLTK